MGGLAAAVLFAAAGSPALGQGTTPPDLTVCDGLTCETVPQQFCTPGGYDFHLVSYDPAPSSPGGGATYVYAICNPTGTCDANSGTKAGNTCTTNSECWGKCTGANQCNNGGAACTTDADCQHGICANRTGGCPAVDDAQSAGLSHLDVVFPTLGGPCLPEDTQVTGTCSCSGGCSVDSTLVVSDGACFDPAAPVAKCDNVNNFGAGSCVTMSLFIPGESTDLGLGLAVVVDKEGNDCQAGCVEGPVCASDSCGGEPPPDGGRCLTRTLGFWGNHSFLIQSDDPRSLDLLPITVCSQLIDATGGTCLSTSQALCSNANDCKQNTPYLALLAQLTAAKLNLAATAAVTEDHGHCGSWTYDGGGQFDGIGIDAIIAACEALCGASNSDISESGCIEALDAFNQDQDTGFESVPPPFERPGPADPSECQAARGDGATIPGGGWCDCTLNEQSVHTKNRRR